MSHTNSVLKLRHFHFPFNFRGKRYFAEMEKINRPGFFRIKQIIPQISDNQPSMVSFDLNNIPKGINSHSDVLTLKILDGLDSALNKRR